MGRHHLVWVNTIYKIHLFVFPYCFCASHCQSPAIFVFSLRGIEVFVFKKRDSHYLTLYSLEKNNVGCVYDLIN